MFDCISEQDGGDAGIGQHLVGRQGIKGVYLCHFAVGNFGKLFDFGEIDGAVGKPVIITCAVVKYICDIKADRARFLIQLALCGIERGFTRLNMTALGFSCGTLFVAAEQELALIAGQNHDIFVFGKCIGGINVTVHRGFLSCLMLMFCLLLYHGLCENATDIGKDRCRGG